MAPSGSLTRTRYTSPASKKLPVRGVTVNCVMGTGLPDVSGRVPRSSTLLPLGEHVSVLRQLRSGREMLMVVSDGSTPLFWIEPTFCSCWLQPLVPRTVVHSSRTLV